MPNHARTQADGTWVDGYTVTPADWEDLERKIFGSWNGDRGGAYVGAGHTINGSGLTLNGSARLTYGGAIYGGLNAFKIRTGHWPLLVEGHAGRTRRIVQPIIAWASNYDHLWSRNHSRAGVGSVALACRKTYGRVFETPELYVPLRVVDGSTLTTVTFRFRVASRRVQAPLAMPKFRVMRAPRDANVFNAAVPLKSTTDGLGYASPTLVTTPDAWYLDGASQTFEYVCNQNNVIDTSLYSYYVQIVEELGYATSEDAFDGIRLVERKEDVLGLYRSTATLSGSITNENFASGTSGSRHIVVDPNSVLDTGATDSNSAKNGIWIDAVGSWTRADDLNEQADFTPNFIVIVTAGVQSYRSVWQCQHPTNTSRVTLSSVASASATQPRFVPAEPKGNIYHSIETLQEVSDLRFQ